MSWSGISVGATDLCSEVCGKGEWKPYYMVALPLNGFADKLAT